MAAPTSAQVGMNVTTILDDMSSAVPSAFVVPSHDGTPVEYIPPLPPNLVLDGAVYIVAFHNLPQWPITGLVIGGIYSLILGVNEASASIDNQSIGSGSATFTATTDTLVLVGKDANLPVTAYVYHVE